MFLPHYEKEQTSAQVSLLTVTLLQAWFSLSQKTLWKKKNGFTLFTFIFLQKWTKLTGYISATGDLTFLMKHGLYFIKDIQLQASIDIRIQDAVLKALNPL